MKQTNTSTGQKNLMKQHNIHSNHTQLPISTQPCFTLCLAGFSSEEITKYRRSQNPLMDGDPPPPSLLTNCMKDIWSILCIKLIYITNVFFQQTWLLLFNYIYIISTAVIADLYYPWQSVTLSHLEKGFVYSRMWKPTYWHLPATARSYQSSLKQV